MKWTLLLVALCLLSCAEQEEQKAGVKVAAIKSGNSSEPPVDSAALQAEEAHGTWMYKTWYELKHEGYSNKKAWLYIDSATKAMFRGVFPSWYQRLKRESDSLLKEKSKYKRVRIV